MILIMKETVFQAVEMFLEKNVSVPRNNSNGLMDFNANHILFPQYFH